jgi:hypothetical protein
VPVKLEKGTQRESQGNHSATKRQLVSIFEGNCFYAEAESVGNLNERSRNHGKAHFLAVLGRLH